jgi:heterodisulfide reductase subunit A2
MTPQIGVFLCTCDGKIEENVLVDAVPYVLRSNEDVALVQPLPHVCLMDGINDLKETIRQNHLDRVVVAACPARFQEKTLRDACMDAGVNRNLFELVDWREGCAYAHRDGKQAITGKAIDLIQMGVARVSRAEQSIPASVQVKPNILVIGGGIAGMTAARTIADRGIKVTLVESEKELGGQWRGASLNGAAQAFRVTLEAVKTHPNIQTLLNSVIVSVGREAGKYYVHIKTPKSSGTMPCAIECGAIIVASGAQEYHAAELYHYDGRQVVTLGEFEDQIPALHSPVSLVYILCAGSRDQHVPYCSNVCCLGALNQAIRFKRDHPEGRVTIVFRDLYLLGDPSNDQLVHEARRIGIEFIRYPVNHPPRVSKDAVEVLDAMTGVARRIERDRVVLATALVPRQDAGMLAHLLMIDRDADGFFPYPHRRLRPESRIDRGIFVCGSAHRPVDIDTAIMQGMTAAARATRFVQKGELRHFGTSAWVDSLLCTGCAQCVGSCTSGSISMQASSRAGHSNGSKPEEFDHAVVDPFLCLGCGNCVVVCPSKAIDLPNSSDAQIFAQIRAALAARHDGAKPALVFACSWSGFAAMELAGARRLTYPANIRVIELPCSARLDAVHVLYAFCNGAERVMLALCPPNECHYGRGNEYAEARVENLRIQLATHGIDPERLQVTRMMGDDAEAWVRAATQVGEGLKQLSSIAFLESRIPAPF